MFVSKINGAQSFHKAVFSGNGQGAGTAAQPDLNKMSDSAKLDLLVKKMNTLQMDVEKMRARQMLADRMIATGVASPSAHGQETTKKMSARCTQPHRFPTKMGGKNANNTAQSTTAGAADGAQRVRADKRTLRQPTAQRTSSIKAAVIAASRPFQRILQAGQGIMQTGPI